MSIHEFRVRGISYCKNAADLMYADYCAAITGAHDIYSHAKNNLRLVPEPDNQYDANSIRIEIMRGEWHKIGYVPKEINQLIRKALEGNIVELYTSLIHKNKGRIGVKIKLVTVAVEDDLEVDFPSESSSDRFDNLDI